MRSDGKKQVGGERKSAWKKRLAALAVLFFLPVTSGCTTAELEDRSFPLEMAVEDTTDFAMEWLSREQAGNKVKDYSHLKVLILSEDLLASERERKELFHLLEEKTDVPRNTYVLVAENPQEILSMESVGTYLEQYIENVSTIDKKFYPTLGMLYQEQENRLETMFIPIVEQEEQQPVISGYYVWVRGNPAGEVSGDVGMLSAFTAGETETYILQLMGNCYVKLWNAHSTLTVADNTIQVNVCCDGEVLYAEDTTTEELKAAAENYMTETAQEVRQAYGIDVSNSYKKLGGQNRELYFYYRQRPQEYEQDMKLRYELKITWVNTE